MMKPELCIGARGWRHESWVGEFYPDDMPRDWWLAYYSNEFDAVLVPWNYLQDAQPDIVQSWLDDTDETFRFFLELPASASKERVKTVLDTLGPRLGGILFNEIINESKISADNSFPLAEWVDIATAYAPLAVDWGSAQSSGFSIVNQYQLGCYWRLEENDPTDCGGSLGIAELNSSSSHDPKSLKNFMQHCRSVHGPTTIGFFFAGDSPSIDEMRNAIMILQMLG